MKSSNSKRSKGTRLCRVAAAVAALLNAPGAFAFDVQFENPDVSLNWDTTLKYSAAARLSKIDDRLTTGSVSAANQDDGDRNFSRGIVSNRLDVFSEADLTYRSFGGRISAAAWYDTVYNRANANRSPGSSNNISVPSNEFPKETRNIMGRKAELLDAFFFGKADLGSVPVHARLGRHALQWGESLFFGSNAIAGAMVPLDIVKVSQVPNSLTREVVRPVGQLSGTAEITPNMSLAGYYQYEWVRSRLPPAGSYFSAGDILDGGGECLRLAAGPACGGPGTLRRLADLEAKDSGQYGLRLKFSDKVSGIDYAFHALKYHSKTPANTLVTGAGPAPVAYRIVFPENIRLYGASVAVNLAGAQWSGEASVRRNTPLVGAAAPRPLTFNNNDNPAYPVGNTAHAQISVLNSLPESFIARSATLLAEVAWNRRLSVTRNPAAVSRTATRDASALRMVYVPAYNQVVDGLDITVPIGLGYSNQGKSSAVSSFATHKGGDVTLGVSGTYLSAWQFSASYRHFIGSTALTQDAANQFTYRQAFSDRNFASFSLSRTF